LVASLTAKGVSEALSSVADGVGESLLAITVGGAKLAVCDELKIWPKALVMVKPNKIMPRQKKMPARIICQLNGPSVGAE